MGMQILDIHIVHFVLAIRTGPVARCLENRVLGVFQVQRGGHRAVWVFRVLRIVTHEI